MMTAKTIYEYEKIITENPDIDFEYFLKYYPESTVIKILFEIMTFHLYNTANPFKKNPTFQLPENIDLIYKFLKDANKELMDPFFDKKILVKKCISMIRKYLDKMGYKKLRNKKEYSNTEKLAKVIFSGSEKDVYSLAFEKSELYKTFLTDSKQISLFLEKIIIAFLKEDYNLIKVATRNILFILNNTDFTIDEKNKFKSLIMDYKKVVEKIVISRNKRNTILNRVSIVSNEIKNHLDKNSINMFNTKAEAVTLEPDFSKRKIMTIDPEDVICREDAFSIYEYSNKYVEIVLYVTDPYAYIDKDFDVYNEIPYLRRNSLISKKTINNISLNVGKPKTVLAYRFLFSDTFELIKKSCYYTNVSVNYNGVYNDKNGKKISKNDILLMSKFINSVKKNDFIPENSFKAFSVDFITNLKKFSNHQIALHYSESKLPFIYRNVTPLNNNFVTNYSINNIGNFRDGFSVYSKSTTPVRSRIALVNHELVKKFIINRNPISDNEMQSLEKRLKFIASLPNDCHK